jgi:hypothetical protein
MIDSSAGLNSVMLFQRRGDNKGGEPCPGELLAIDGASMLLDNL